MQTVIAKAQAAFELVFNTKPEHLIQAPGRVNLIGEHTDYNDGFVLPCAINYYTVVAASKRQDNLINVVAVDYGNAQDQFSLDAPIMFVEDKDKFWANYIRGVIKFLLARGYQFSGMDLSVSGNVPQGAGLSSSAALEVVIGQTVKTLFNLSISQAEIALNGQQAENEFVGCNCGIMDQMISAKGQAGHAMLLDCRSLETQAVAMPDSLAILIINSNKKRGLVDSEYNTRRQQCEAAAKYFNVKALRDVNLAEFEAKQAGLDLIVAKRAKHIITENQRTLDAAKALESGNITQLSKLMAQSHASMRDDFEITVKEIDLIVELVSNVIGEQGGVRMTGGGFGGCVVSLLPQSLIAPVKAAIEAEYQAKTGLVATFYECYAVDGAGEIK